MVMTESATRPGALSVTPAGVLGTLLVLVVVAVCARLGFWQLDRLSERRALNAGVAARLHAAPIDDVSALADTTGLFYRVVTTRGLYDNERSIILPGRSHQGVPGVHLLTPLRIEGHAEAVLVNRGWVPSADAATVPLEQFIVTGATTVRGLVLPFPGANASLAPRASGHDSAGFRRTWFRIDAAALRAQYPYRLYDVTVQQLPAADAPRYPIRLDPPALNQGSHLGYAMQWFSFALIALIGWLAMVLRSRAPRRAAPVAALFLLLVSPATAAAQLRPLDPMDWHVYDGGTFLVGSAGVGALWGQPATLAGVEGRLLELGNYRVTFRIDRMAIELAGTALWRLTEQEVIAPPANGVDPSNGSPRQDAGFASAATILNLTSGRLPVDVVVRFGARIPTTSDESGLDRDRTDFFAVAGMRYQTGALSFTAENGLGIHGTNRPGEPQTDVWAYSFGTEYRHNGFFGNAQLVGHQDGRRNVLRGNEDLRELRIGGGFGHERTVDFTYIRGLSDFSPRHGLRLNIGIKLHDLF